MWMLFFVSIALNVRIKDKWNENGGLLYGNKKVSIN